MLHLLLTILIHFLSSTAFELDHFINFGENKKQKRYLLFFVSPSCCIILHNNCAKNSQYYYLLTSLHGYVPS